MSLTPQVAQIIMAVIFGGIAVALAIWGYAAHLLRKQALEEYKKEKASESSQKADSGPVPMPAFAHAHAQPTERHSQRDVDVPDGIDYIPD